MREMKDSGVEWIGEIPSDWELTKIGSVYDERNTKVSDEDYPPLSVTKQGVVPQLETAAKTDNGDNRKLICKNDFVINSRSDRRGSCGISEYEGSCSLINTVLMPQRHMCNRYYGYVFKSDLFANEYYRWGHGIVDDLWSTKWLDMKNIYIPMPPLAEQEHRADYLDSKCSKIDEIIAKQEQIIEKLKEYKLSIISETVTRGLDKSTKLKDSKSSVLGKIAETWDSAQLKYLHAGLTDGTHGTYERLDSGRVLLSSKNVREESSEMGDNESYISEEDFKEITSCGFPRKDDVLLCCIGASIGRCVIYGWDHPEAFQRSVIMIRSGKRILPRFLMYSMRSKTTLNQEQLLVNQSAQPGLYQGLVSRLYITVPPLKEQEKIIRFLDNRTIEINNSIKTREEMILSLQKYKKSLIYEVVTGKKEV